MSSIVEGPPPRWLWLEEVADRAICYDDVMRWAMGGLGHGILGDFGAEESAVSDEASNSENKTPEIGSDVSKICQAIYDIYGEEVCLILLDHLNQYFEKLDEMKKQAVESSSESREPLFLDIYDQMILFAHLSIACPLICSDPSKTYQFKEFISKYWLYIIHICLILTEILKKP